MKKILPLLFAMIPGVAMAQSDDGAAALGAGIVFLLAFLFLGLIFYFVPTAVAQYRKAANFTTVLLINIFLGWTAIGWIVALILAFAGDSGEQARRHREMMEALNKNNKNP